MRSAVFVAALLFSTSVGATDWCAINIPPIEYQYEPTQSYAVFDWPHDMLEGLCRGNGGMQWRPEGSHGGCWVQDEQDPDFVVIFLLAGLAPDQRECVLVHEKAHMNGWRHGPGPMFYLDGDGEYRPQRGPLYRPTVPKLERRLSANRP